MGQYRNLALFVGEQLILSATAGILVGLMPLFSAGFSKGLLPGERLDAVDAVGVLLGFAGIVAISAPMQGHSSRRTWWVNCWSSLRQ